MCPYISRVARDNLYLYNIKLLYRPNRNMKVENSNDTKESRASLFQFTIINVNSVIVNVIISDIVYSLFDKYFIVYLRERERER